MDCGVAGSEYLRCIAVNLKISFRLGIKTLIVSKILLYYLKLTPSLSLKGRGWGMGSKYTFMSRGWIQIPVS